MQIMRLAGSGMMKGPSQVKYTFCMALQARKSVVAMLHNTTDNGPAYFCDQNLQIYNNKN